MIQNIVRKLGLRVGTGCISRLHYKKKKYITTKHEFKNISYRSNEIMNITSVDVEIIQSCNEWVHEKLYHNETERGCKKTTRKALLPVACSNRKEYLAR